LIIENDVNHHSLKTGTLFAQLQRKAVAQDSQQPLRVIVICRTPSSTNTLERSLGEPDGRKIVEFVCQPCGPRKLGKTLLRCFTRSADTKSISTVSQKPDCYPLPSPPDSTENLSRAHPQRPLVTRRSTRPNMPPSPPTEAEAYSPGSPSNIQSDAAQSTDTGPFLLVDDNHINLQVH